MKVKLLNTYARPGASGWITCAISVTLGLIAIGALAIGSTEVKQSIAYDGLEKSFAKKQWLQSDRFYRQLTEEPGTIERLVRTGLFRATGVQGIPSTAGKVNYEVARLLMSGNLDAAAPLYLHNKNDVITDFRRNFTPHARTGVKEFETVAFELEGQFQHYLKERKELVALSRELKSIEQKIVQNTERFQIVAKDVEALFNLRQVRISDPQELPVYRSGVLAGLPMLESLPDQLLNLVELREELDLAGGEVSVSGPDAAQEFMLKLEMLQQSSATFVETHSDLVEKKEGISNRIIAIRKARHTSAAELQKSVNRLVLAEMGNAGAIQRYFSKGLAT